MGAVEVARPPSEFGVWERLRRVGCAAVEGEGDRMLEGVDIERMEPGWREGNQQGKELMY